MIGTVKNWMRQAGSDGQIPHRWACSQNIVAQSVIDKAVALGWVISMRVDDCWLTDAGRAALAKKR